MKNFKEFVKETENTLDEGIMDMLKGLGRTIGKGIVGTAKGIGAVGGALVGGAAGGAKAGFRTMGGSGGGGGGVEKDSPKEAQDRRSHELALAQANKPSAQETQDSRAHSDEQSRLDREHREKIARLELLASRNRSSRRRRDRRPSAGGTP